MRNWSLVVHPERSDAAIVVSRFDAPPQAGVQFALVEWVQGPLLPVLVGMGRSCLLRHRHDHPLLGIALFITPLNCAAFSCLTATQTCALPHLLAPILIAHHQVALVRKPCAIPLSWCLHHETPCARCDDGKSLPQTLPLMRPSLHTPWRRQ
jgi:hypothetical protein